MNNINHFIPKNLILDFSECGYLGEIHEIIKTQLDLPQWYGQNLDALWDSITGIMYVPADITIIYKPKTKGGERLSLEVEKIIDVFKEAEREYGAITVHVKI